MAFDAYMLDIAEKDASSSLLAEFALPTLNNQYIHQVVPGKNGLSFLKVPEDQLLVGHSSGGDYRIYDPGLYACSVLARLLDNTRKIGAIPVAVADVIDANSTDESFVRAVGEPFARMALENRIPILNGELAKLGQMVNCPCNISGTMLGMIAKDKAGPGSFRVDGVKYFAFDPRGKYVWMNSDGVGTKSLIYSRFGEFERGVDDLFAMQCDDKGKFGGGAVASFNLLEVNGDAPYQDIIRYAERRGIEIGITPVMQLKECGGRIRGIHGEKEVFNMSGTLVSLVDESMVNDMPRPKEGDSLIAIRGYGRSNGFTDRRNLVVEWFGRDWHNTEGGRYFGEFLTKPSIIFYPVFAELIGKHLANSVYHMSGGAFRDKLSKPIAKHGLYAEIGIEDGSPQLFRPDPREATFASHFNIANAYAKFAMDNEGFVSTDKPKEVLQILRERSLEAKVVSRLERRPGVKGVRLRAFNGDVVDFTMAL